MKNAKFLLVFLYIISCNGQDNKSDITYPKQKQMNTEHFDFKNFKNYQEKQELLQDGNPSERILIKGDTIIKEYSLISSENGIEYMKEIIPPKPNLFYSIYIYNSQGKIKSSIDKVFIGFLNFEYDKHHFYSNEGFESKTIDYNKQFVDFKIKLDDLLKILSNEKIRIDSINPETKMSLKNRWFEGKENFTNELILEKIKEIFKNTEEERGNFELTFLNPFNRQDVERIKIDFDSERKIWIVTKDYSSLGKIKITVDGENGKIIDNEFEL